MRGGVRLSVVGEMGAGRWGVSEEAYATVLADKIQQTALVFVHEYGVDYKEARTVAEWIAKGALAEKKLEEWKRGRA